MVDWWQAFSLADESTREDLVQQLRAEQQRSKKSPRVHSVKKRHQRRQNLRRKLLKQ